MKKLFFAFVFIFAAAMLSGCNTDRTRTVVFTENPPSLTTMTITTTSFVDTFSEYMATYSASETAAESSRGNPNTVSRPPRVAPDTGFDRGGAEQVSRDTAAVFTYVATGEVSSFAENSETTVTEVPESETESTTTSVVETAAETESSTVSAVTNDVPSDTALKDRPKRDTAFSQEITRDTVYSSSSFTENGGTTNADKYTE